jgi:hypothetical protein
MAGCGSGGSRKETIMSTFITSHKSFELYAIESDESCAKGVWAFDDRVTDRTPDELRWNAGELASDCSEGVEGPFPSVEAAIEWLDQSERELTES